MYLHEQIDNFGFARVMVAIKATKSHRIDGRMALDLAATQSIQAELAAMMSAHFQRFELSRGAQVAAQQRSVRKLLSATDAFLPKPVKAPPPVRYFEHLGILFGTVDRSGLKALEKLGSRIASLSAVPEFSLIRPVESVVLAAPALGLSWGLKHLNISAAWDQGFTGKDVLIGHLDTGVQGTHPALLGRVDAYAEFDEIGMEVLGATARDSGIHGTHTAGLLVGQEVDGLRFGVAPDAKLASAAVIELGDVPARLVAGLNWAVGQGVRVLNLSLGFRGYDPQFETLIGILRARDILPVIAIGNEGPGSSRSPGNYAQVLSVGALDEADQVWGSSSSIKFTGKVGRIKPDLLAPGAMIVSCVPGGLASLSGTSMATPHIAGLAALLLEKRPEATVDALETAIYKSCKRPSAISTLRGNRGVPDAKLALAALK